MRHSAPPRQRTLLLLLAALAAAACAPAHPPPPDGMQALPPPQAPMSQSGLVSTLEVETAADTVIFTLRITNPSTEPVAFTFPSGQSYDFIVRPAGAGAEAWRWSADRGFIQAVQERTLEPGGTWTFSERWARPAGLRGEFAAIARLTSSDRPVERTAAFRLP